MNQKNEFIILKILSYLRAPIATVLNLLLTIIGTTLFTICSFIKNSKIDNWIIFQWANSICKVSGVDIKKVGFEKIPESEGCLFVFNHSSFFDILVMYGSIRKPFRFGAKSELFSVPFLGMTLKAMGALPIHRGKRSEVLKLYEKSVHRIERGESFALAPEGTRQDQPEIGRFKTGPFIFAIQAKAPIVPVIIRGADKVLPKKSYFVQGGRWRREVTIEILSPIQAKDYSSEQIEILKTTTRDRMVKAFDGANTAI